ncbi:MAG: biosynthetic-type acetolactate synthase large subunit [Defluviitaleaceae bacterium]|nr:biosynthetic-type acetolactate synthase large subunit [Defluviitaleaceae bacterium]
MKLTGAEILLECLLEQGVNTIFGYPGGAVLPIYDALYKYSDKLNHYLVSHEQGAAHAADGYARTTGKVGVCLATSGPGATNLVTGIATAYMDSVPMVAITGNVALPLLGKDSFQEVDITGITMPITKHNFIVKNVEHLADIIRRAFNIAAQGRQGPVLVDIPRDITLTTTEYHYKPPLPTTLEISHLTAQSLEQAVEMLQTAEKPLVYAGGGVISANATAELTEFVELLDAPCCTSAMGIGGFPYSHPHHVGTIGMHGTATSNTLATDCDCLVAIGARFSDRVTSNISRFAPNAKILHIDIDPAEINKNVQTHHHIIGDVKAALARLNRLITPRKDSEWLNLANNLKAKYPTKYTANSPDLKPQYIIERLSQLAATNNAITVTEVGQHQMWACRYMQVENPRRFITSGGLGTMGFGLGAAIGTAIGNPGVPVFNIAGDGCFRMNNIELATAVEYNLPVITVILNNHVLGMVRQWQSLFFGGRYSHTDLRTKTTDFAKLAEAYNATAYTITKPEEVDSTILQAISLKAPVVINCEIDVDDKVFPMVPPGAGLDQYVLGENSEES